MPELPALVQDVVSHYLAALDELAPGVVEGLYLTGSVALGDFRPGQSDIDFLAATRAPLAPAARESLGRVHARLAAHHRRPYFDGTYVTPADLRDDPEKAPPRPTIHENRWGDLETGAGNPVTWHELAWHGVTVRGPDCRGLEVWTDPDALVRWTRRNMHSYWASWVGRVRHPLSLLGVASLGAWAPAWGVLGVARQHYTIATGRITSKYGAGLYARDVFAPRWHRIIDECLRIRTGERGGRRYAASPFARRRDMLNFMDAVMADVLGPIR